MQEYRVVGPSSTKGIKKPGLVHVSDFLEKVHDKILKMTFLLPEESLQCSVCWDDFKVDESVRQLRCEHIFHKDCIVPWLELHATCPVCRQPLTEDAKAHAERQDQEDGADVPAMAAAAQAAAAAAGGSAGSSAASSSNQSSDGSMPPRPDRLHRPPPQRNTHRTQNLAEAQQQMDVSDSLTDTISAVINSFMGG